MLHEEPYETSLRTLTIIEVSFEVSSITPYTKTIHKKRPGNPNPNPNLLARLPPRLLHPAASCSGVGVHLGVRVLEVCGRSSVEVLVTLPEETDGTWWLLVLLVL